MLAASRLSARQFETLTTYVPKPHATHAHTNTRAHALCRRSQIVLDGSRAPRPCHSGWSAGRVWGALLQLIGTGASAIAAAATAIAVVLMIAVGRCPVLAESENTMRDGIPCFMDFMTDGM